MTKTNCENCMWGDNCPVSEDCKYYDPLDEDYSEELTDIRRSFDEDWQRYVHSQYNDRKIPNIFKLLY